MTLVTRAQWSAKPANGSMNAISAHPKGVAVHYEAVNVGNATHGTCEQNVRNIQADHMRATARHDAWSDIAYNYLACQHGYLFVGRGTGKGSAANGTTVANQNYYAVCGLIGPKDVPTPQLVTAIGDGINLCRAAGAGNTVVGHRDLIATACPGAALYKMVQGKRWSGFVTPPHTAPVVVTGARVPVLLAVDGVFGVTTRKRFQQWAHVTADGILGYNTWHHVQVLVHVTPTGTPDHNTWVHLQRLVGAKQDGDFGPMSVTALQRYLNRAQ